MRPRVGKTYYFVRKNGEGFEHTEFIRNADGSVGFFADGFHHVHEGHPDAWQGALDQLASAGFLEMEEAKSAGLLPSEWLPTPATLAYGRS